MKRNDLVLKDTLEQKIQTLFDDFISCHKMNIKLSFIAPIGYETSNGTFDVCKNTLFLNLNHIKNKPEYEIFFYLIS